MSDSFVWKHFVKSDSEDCAVCNKCRAKLKCKGWSTSGLIRHLQSKHKIEKPAKRSADDKIANQQAGPSNKRQHVQPTLNYLIKRETLK